MTARKPSLPLLWEAVDCRRAALEEAVARMEHQAEGRHSKGLRRRDLLVVLAIAAPMGRNPTDPLADKGGHGCGSRPQPRMVRHRRNYAVMCWATSLGGKTLPRMMAGILSVSGLAIECADRPHDRVLPWYRDGTVI